MRAGLTPMSFVVIALAITSAMHYASNRGQYGGAGPDLGERSLWRDETAATEFVRLLKRRSGAFTEKSKPF
jgi:hypothetical protein